MLIIIYEAIGNFVISLSGRGIRDAYSFGLSIASHVAPKTTGPSKPGRSFQPGSCCHPALDRYPLSACRRSSRAYYISLPSWEVRVLKLKIQQSNGPIAAFYF
jgi:hypothetical protein